MGRVLRILTRMTLIALAIHESSSLRNVRLAAPQSAERNAKVILKCLYELENENLYTVKWYRGDREFCRYSPGDAPQVKVFDLPGIEVVREETDEKQLTMIPSYPQSTVQGKYTCEVSADVPSFQTARVHTFMYIVDLPRSKLELVGMKPKYKPGMKLKVECICRDSLPPVNLTFYVNDHAARSQHVTHRVDGGNGPDGLMTAYSVIQFVVQKHHFYDNRLRIRCVSEIYDIYYWSSERCSLEEVMKTTPSSVMRQEDTIVIPINRKKKTPSVSGFARSLVTTPIPFTVIPMIALILPTVLR